MSGRRSRLRAKAGFTLIESLIVLAVTGLTLALVFSVTSRSAVTGYRLGDRAQGVAEGQVATAAYRGVIASFVVPPLTTRAQAEGGLEEDAMDTTFSGDARQVSGEWLANRGSPCGPVGTYGRLTLALVAQPGGTAVTCQVDDAEPAVLMTLKFQDAEFQYSEDASVWRPAWVIEAGQPVEDQLDPNSEARKVYVRLVTGDGSSDLMELASTGHPVTVQGQARGG
jgi:prepilin-type N-terminal cleavage/methylation domain-containing protein